MKRLTIYGASALVAGTLVLQGCNHTDDSSTQTERNFSVEIGNSTNHQPFAPAGVVLHSEGYHAYSLGGMASTGLESLAEGGDGTELLAAADADSHVLATEAGTGVVAPGMKETIQVQGLGEDPRLSVVAMLVNTNDGFIGVNGVDVSDLAVGESMTVHARVYDAGTESNDEAAAHMPGQGGEGFNASRDDRDFVAVHPGVVSMDDGLTSSALDQSHRFDNPGARIVVTRTQ